MASQQDPIIDRLDAVVHDFCSRTRFFKEPMTPGRAKMFVLQHRQNTRQRNSVLKLKVAANCPDWETRLAIIGACTQEVIADHEHGHGKAHWQILEELGTSAASIATCRSVLRRTAARCRATASSASSRRARASPSTRSSRTP